MTSPQPCGCIQTLTENELWVEASGDQSSDMRIIIQNAIGKRVLDATYVYDPVVKVDLTRLRREPGLYMITVRRKTELNGKSWSFNDFGQETRYF